MLAWGAGADREDVGLICDAKIADLTGDHLQPRLGTEEPAANLLEAAQRPGVIADVNPHLDLVIHHRDRRRAIAVVEPFEEDFHRVDCTHAGKCTEAAA